MFVVTSTGIDRMGEEDSHIRCFEALCLTREIAEEYVNRNTEIINGISFNNSILSNEFKIEEIEPISKI